jgi:hypothetical protein
MAQPELYYQGKRTIVPHGMRAIMKPSNRFQMINEVDYFITEAEFQTQQAEQRKISAIAAVRNSHLRDSEIGQMKITCIEQGKDWFFFLHAEIERLTQTTLAQYPLATPPPKRSTEAVHADNKISDQELWYETIKKWAATAPASHEQQQRVEEAKRLQQERARLHQEEIMREFEQHKGAMRIVQRQREEEEKRKKLESTARHDENLRCLHQQRAVRWEEFYQSIALKTGMEMTGVPYVLSLVGTDVTSCRARFIQFGKSAVPSTYNFTHQKDTLIAYTHINDYATRNGLTPLQGEHVLRDIIRPAYDIFCRKEDIRIAQLGEALDV